MPMPAGAASVRRCYQNKMRVKMKVNESQNVVGYLGPRGTFSEEVAMEYGRGNNILLRPCASIEQVVRAVEAQEVRYGIVPVENSLEGSVNLTLDLLNGEKGVRVCGEMLHRVKHFLLALPGQTTSGIEEIYSHPQALAQCREFIEERLPGVSCREMASTAEAAGKISGQKSKAVIASRKAAGLYGLEVIARDIQDEENNITRFLLLSGEDAFPTGDDKTSLLLGLRDRPGSLYALLGIFARYQLNLTKIESRPIRGDLGKYKFFLDVEGHRSDKRVAGALQEIEQEALFLKILGSYPRAVL